MGIDFTQGSSGVGALLTFALSLHLNPKKIVMCRMIPTPWRRIAKYVSLAITLR